MIKSNIDEDVLEKDLYKILGLKESCSTKDVKKAYRKLAQIHHPDKHLTNKEANEEIFREIASAYEILSDATQREEYDALRAARKRDSDLESKRKQQFQYNKQQSDSGSPYTDNSRNYRDSAHRSRYYDDSGYNDDFYDYFAADNNNDFGSYTENLQFSPGYFRPTLGGPFIPSRTVIFPYSPIMTSMDRSHFAFLDLHCSFGVYKGDPDMLLGYLLTSDQPDLTKLPVELKFRTRGEPSSRGNCFAGLDDNGMFWVLQGHPDDIHTAPIWSSEAPGIRKEKHNVYFSRYYLELSSLGEMAVRMVTAGSTESVCIWSTTSCNQYIALMHEVIDDVSRTLQNLKSKLALLAREIIALFHSLILVVKSENRWADILHSIQSFGDYVARKSRNLWDRKRRSRYRQRKNGS
jgi:curved DNA-binding protein CbpA